MNDARIGVLLGSDSLLHTRSGVGRQALEIARRLRQAPQVAGLDLLVGAQCLRAEALDTLSAQPMPGASGSSLRSKAAAIPGAAAVRAAWQRRQMNRHAAAMARRIGSGTGVVYHEVNMIARPFDGITVATMHDLSWRADPRWHPADRVAWIERRLPRTLAQATRLVCVSNFTAMDLQRQFGVAASRIDVVHPGVSPIFRPVQAEAAAPVLAEFDLRERGYLLAVSTLEPRKNYDRLLTAHAMLPPTLRQRFPLVIAGGPGWGDTLADGAAERARRSGALRLLGHVTDDTLAALYARCAAVAYVSLYEGFGLPVLEAMACGAPVIASRSTAVGETAGDAALLVDPEDTADIVGGLVRLLTDATLAAELARLGGQRAAGFTWDAMALGLLASWRTALGLSDHQPEGRAQQAPE
ncbi:MAG TPA: glycosyltransferase family 1 protein [Acetobacteraceae bacterium]|jgi:glycosyltransferase involved in cell wall biosynthesis|nr:glycosyltransferase family 1 protein [Acetobacteraceae bacterium]